MTYYEFAEKVWEGGYHPTYAVADMYHTLLDAEAWKAVGKAEGEKSRKWRGFYKGLDNGTWSLYDLGNKSDGEIFTERWVPAWLYNMHRMIDALAEGKSIEEFLATL